jgi:hypothetical protein
VYVDEILEVRGSGDSLNEIIGKVGRKKMSMV